MATTTKQKIGWGSANAVIMLVVAHPGAVDRVAVVQGPGHHHRRQLLGPKRWTLENYRGIFKTSEFTRALINSIGIALISTLIAVVFASMAAYAVARLRFPGKSLLIGMSLLIAMFPAISLVTPAVQHRAVARPVRHLAGPDHPLRHLRAAAGHLHAVGVLPGDPVGAREGRQDGRRHPVPGVHQGHRAAGRAGHVHHRDPRVHPLLERLPVRDLADVDRPRPAPCRRPSASSAAARSSPRRPARSPPPPSIITIPIIVFVLLFQRRIVAGLTSGAVKG